MKEIRWGILGAGGIADRRTLPGMEKAASAKIYAVMEVEAQAAERLRAKYGAERAYIGEDALLADPAVEAVYIASPVSCHARQCEKAARAGKHILVEKPVAMTAGESAALCALGRAAGVKMAAGLMMRYNACHREMRRLVAEGALGQLVSMRAQFTCWYPDMANCWRQEKARAGGGAMTDMGIHSLDLIEYLSGQRIARVGAMMDTMTFHYDVEDSCTALLRLTGGALCTVEANFNIPDEAAKCRLEIYGTKGSLRAEGTIGQEDGGEVIFTAARAQDYDAQQARRGESGAPLRVEAGDLYAREVESFSRSILEDAPEEVPAEDAARVQRVIEAIYRSAQSGQFLDVENV